MRPHLSLFGWTMVIAIGWLTVLGPGRIEGHLFPVLKNVQLTSVLPDPADPVESSLVTGEFDKVRNCSARYVEWFIGERGGLNHLAYVWGPPRLRPVGHHQFGEWKVQIGPPEVVITQSFADILHRCSLTIPVLELRIEFPWLTRTAFWR